MVILIILAIITSMIAGWYAYNTTDSESVKKRNKSLVLTIIFYTISIQLFSSAIQISLDKQKPSALDVYRGKTELKINKTYENDSIVVECDSMVVFKKIN